jgi:tetratricopeptide (TPR) repeat protein
MSDAAPAGPAADRNLLFGILAVQMDFVSRDALVAAMHAWVLAKHRPLGEILVEHGALTPEQRALLDAMVAEHLRAHGGDPRRSLEAVAVPPTMGDVLQSVADPDLHASLAAAGATLPTTADFRPTEDGLRYRFLRPHARGGLGVVSVARDAELGREVALKEMQPDHAADPASRGRFVREAEITGGLEHPGVVPVYGLGRYADGRPYYAMRFVRGETLQEAVKKLHAGEPGHTLRGLLTRFVAVCNAVAYAHSRGVIHRDLKPSNVMLGPYGETLVVDWGLAKVVGREPTEGAGAGERTLHTPSGEGSQTQAGSALGTPAFMSPEQARGEVAGLGPATDVYSLGATLYAVLAGRAPVQGRAAAEVLDKVRRGNWPAPRQVQPSVPKALDAVCRKAMAPRPADRYASALDLAADLERWLADQPVTAWREPWTARAGRWVRRHRTKVAASAAAAFVALLLGGAGLVRQQLEQARQRQEQDRRLAAAEAALERLNGHQSRGRWAEARAALEQAEDRLGGSAPAVLRQRVEEARRNLELVTRLDAIAQQRSAWQSVDSRAQSDRAYEAAFAAAGLGVPGNDPAGVARRVADSPVREALLAALDNWALAARGDTPRRAWALEVARRADPDPWRDRLRDPTVWHDAEALPRLANEVPPAAATPALAAAVGEQLGRMGKGAEGERLLRTAQALRPADFWLNFTLADALTSRHQYAAAEGFYRAAVAARPDGSAAVMGLGLAVNNQGRLEDAVSYFRKSLELDPGAPGPYINLSVALLRQGKAAESASVAREGIRTNPREWFVHASLAEALLALGRYDEAGDSAQRAKSLLPAGAPPAELEWFEQVRRRVQLGVRLASVLRGDGRLASPAEGIELADLCYRYRRYADIARLSAYALATYPEPADGLHRFSRYNAARFAALAACGKGEDAANLKAEERVRWRNQAKVWLRADLAAWSGRLKGSPTERAEAIKQLRHWLEDEDFVGVRDAAGLGHLPEAERKEWEALWAEVKAVLDKPPAGK